MHASHRHKSGQLKQLARSGEGRITPAYPGQWKSQMKSGWEEWCTLLNFKTVDGIGNQCKAFWNHVTKSRKM